VSMAPRTAGISSAPHRRLKLMIGAQFAWLLIVCLLGAWWCRLVLSQAGRIAELESAAGLPFHLSQNQIERTHRMLYWESGTYVLLLLASTAIVFWLYWRDALRARGVHAFFASMTHELRTPLTSIRLQAESIADALPEDGATRSLVHRLLEDTMRLEGQVERTLELARVEGGGQIFPEALELRPWFGRLLSAWNEAYGERVRFEAAISDVTAMADATALQVIMKNLLENSLRHAKREPVQVTISAATPTDEPGGAAFVELNYRDNGAEFTGDARKLGQIFQKGAGSQGAGVGLYLIRVLAEQMGGQVDFLRGAGFAVRVRLKAAAVGHG
jgi:signal transduction histidine kinase